jgi:hypothetical protein
MVKTTLPALLLLVTTPALAAPVEDPRSVEARKACVAGDVDKGIRILVDQLAATDDPTIIYNMGRCYEQNGVVDKARLQFQEYLRKARNLPADERQEVEGHIRALEAEQERRARLQQISAAPRPPATATPPPAPAPVATGAAPVAVGQAATPRRHGPVLALLYLGMHGFHERAGNQTTPGLRLGGLLGGRLSDVFSLNGEFAADLLRFKDLPDGVTASAAEVDLAFSPMIHVLGDKVELALGPRLGFWGGYGQLKATGRLLQSEKTLKISGSGALYGLNAGLFASLGTASLGMLASYSFRSVGRTCLTDGDLPEACDDSPSQDAERVWSVSGALLF